MKEFDSWKEWTFEPPDSSLSGNIEAVWYVDGEKYSCFAYLYHYANGDSKWGFSQKELDESGKIKQWKTVHPIFFKWRYINGEVPESEIQGNSILIWHWHNAPGELRSYSTHGGDEDWVALIPRDLDIPSWMDSEPFSICRNDEIILSDGRILIITAHA